MRRRAEQVDETRRRITDAAVRLHTSVGPARTSIAAVAEEAGVTRLTVYRHFADLEAIFEACMSHWAAGHPWPDPSAWATIDDPAARAASAFAELYPWYRANAGDLYPITRDAAAMPSRARAAAGARREAMAVAILGRSGRPASARALVHHLVDFRTWRSLAIEQGLDDRELVALAVRLVLVASGASLAKPAAS